MKLKEIIRNILIFFHLDLTKNLAYDRLTLEIIKQAVKPGYNCIDIGCHKGEILDVILKHSPKGKHFGFEPLPKLFENLKIKYVSKATIYPYALAEKNGNTSFQFVKNAPAYSGIKKRRYDIDNPEIEEINVELKKLDDIIPPEITINFVKIDVEGAELGVLKGAKRILTSYKPVVIFEFGLGASDFYGTKPADIYNYLVNEIGLNIFTLKGWLNQGKSLSLKELDVLFIQGNEYYFIAAPR